jgi:hypothetical protein
MRQNIPQLDLDRTNGRAASSKRGASEQLGSVGVLVTPSAASYGLRGFLLQGMSYRSQILGGHIQYKQSCTATRRIVIGDHKEARENEADVNFRHCKQLSQTNLAAI